MKVPGHLFETGPGRIYTTASKADKGSRLILKSPPTEGRAEGLGNEDAQGDAARALVLLPPALPGLHSTNPGDSVPGQLDQGMARVVALGLFTNIQGSLFLNL